MGGELLPPKIEKILRVMPGVRTESGFTLGSAVADGPRQVKFAAKTPPPLSVPVKSVPRMGMELSAVFNA